MTIPRRSALVGAMAVLGATGLLAVRPATSASHEADEELLRALPIEISDAWNAGDGGRLADSFAGHGVLVSSDGAYCDGRSEIDRYLTRLFATHLKGSRFTIKVISVRFPAPDMALMHLEGDFWVAGATEPAPERRAVQSLVAVREAGRWRVALFQATRTRPPGTAR